MNRNILIDIVTLITFWSIKYQFGFYPLLVSWIITSAYFYLMKHPDRQRIFCMSMWAVIIASLDVPWLADLKQLISCIIS